MVKLCNAASTFFHAQPEGMGLILSTPSLLAAYRRLFEIGYGIPIGGLRLSQLRAVDLYPRIASTDLIAQRGNCTCHPAETGEEIHVVLLSS